MSLNFLRFSPEKITSFFPIQDPRISELNIKYFLLLSEPFFDKLTDRVPYLAAICQVYIWSEKAGAAGTEAVVWSVILTTTVLESRAKLCARIHGVHFL